MERGQSTYILDGGENGGDGGALQVSDPPADIEAVVCEVLAAQVLMSARGPLLSLHVVHPFLQPGLVLQGEPLGDKNRGMYLGSSHVTKKSVISLQLSFLLQNPFISL